MTIELLPVGDACNLRCRYCFCGDRARPACDRLDEMIRIGLGQKGALAIHGGEPLLTPLDQLEQIFAANRCAGYKPGLQTNGTLITDEHVRLFGRYDVGVGISIDGPGELNDLRLAACGDLKRTRELTHRTIANIAKLRRMGIAVDVIVTVHRLNGTPDRLGRLIRFADWLLSIGVRHANFHWLQPVEPGADYVLDPDEEISAFMKLAEHYDSHPGHRWAPFEDIKKALGGDGQRLCLWNGCDPLCTSGVYGIAADLSIRNCERLGTWLKASSMSFERYQCLGQASMVHGGCADCRWWGLCLGGCPAEAIEGDWRNRTVHCRTVQALMRHYEDRLLAEGMTPASVPERRKARIEALMAAWRAGRQGTDGHGDGHGDHTDATGTSRTGSGHGDGHGDAHGDSPHGDAHGDHTDTGARR